MIKLFELRNEKGLSQRELAKVMNVSQGTYNNWENGKTQPSIEQLIAFSAFFGVTVDYLIGNAEESVFSKGEYTDGEKKLLGAFRAMSPTAQEYLLGFVQNCIKK